ncbi:MAG: hypothetical protein K0R38_6335 [Polyangiaceae bacterium]|jgi:spermidine synthase|nr:hypothetical protein [Polyangiaceae bacterium]
MLPLQTVATAQVGGRAFVLARRGDEWLVRVDGHVLMSSRQHGSEESLATEALSRVAKPGHVLIGGLGLGYTLRAVLDRVGEETRVHVAELVPELVDWNRAHLGALNGQALSDARVQVYVGDVGPLLRRSAARFDAILLDVDNGPVALSQAGNSELYTARGVRDCHEALRPGGVLTVWSAGPSESYERLLSQNGFEARSVRVAVTRAEKSGARHVIFVAQRR